MKFPYLLLRLRFFCITLIFAFFFFDEVRGQCLDHHKSLLLKFKHSLVIDESHIHDKSSKLANWISSADCCLWPGVTCSGVYVSGLDLSNEGIVGGFNDSSSLFDLTSLTSLNLAMMHQQTVIPSGIGRLVNLMALNLTRSGFIGLIPIEISNLTRFGGGIPHELGELKFLYALNLSNNYLSGRIPPSFGNLYRIESLDLSKNELSGKIPGQLAALTFLSLLNLSFNHLEGMVPKGSQFDTFTEASFMGNEGLCGQPLKKSCGDGGVSSPPNQSSEAEDKFRDIFIATEIGYALGLGLVIMPLIFWSRWRNEYYEWIDKVLMSIFCCCPLASKIRRRR